MVGGENDSESESESDSDSDGGSGRGSERIGEMRVKYCRIVSRCDATLMRKGRCSWQLGSGSLMWTPTGGW